MPNPKKPFDTELYGPTYRPEGTGKHGTRDGMVQEGDDIPEGGKGATRATLGDYLSNLTKGAPHANHYPIEPGTKEAASHRDVGGSPKLFAGYKDGGAPSGSGAEKTFLDDAIDAAKDVDGGVTADHFILTGKNTYKNPGIDGGTLTMAEAGGGDEVYEKGVGATRGTGHTLYSGIQKVIGNVKWYPGNAYAGDEVGSHEIQKRVSKILHNNRFHPTKGSPYVVDGEFSTGKRGTMGSVQRTLGAYDPLTAGMEIEDMMEIGRKIMIAGTGHGASTIEDVAALLPSFNQLGIPFLDVDSSDIQMAGIAKELGFDTLHDQASRSDMINMGGDSAQGVAANEGPTSGGRGISGPGSSYGHLNSYYEPFSGVLPMGMAMVALGGLLALLIQAAAILLIFTLLTLLPTADPLSRDPENPLTLPKGKRQYERHYSFIVGPVIRMLGIPEFETEAGLFACIMRGVGSFYNIPNLSGVPSLGELGALMVALIEQGGFVASIIRYATRDLEQVINVATGMRKSFASVSAGVIGLIKALGDATSIKFLMLCAKLGDQLFVADSYQYAPYRQNPDVMAMNGTTRLAKSRKGQRELTLVWAHSTLPSAFLLPRSIRLASLTYGLGQGQGHSALIASPGMSELPRVADFAQIDPATGKLKSDYVKEIEDQLETEYVPFYFQDLRTNEIIAFHAFLGGIKDDYSPNYSSMGGYGRMDKVQIYQSTERSISFSFHVVATSPEDFDAMWYSINKLVTLVYPQWSGGTVMKADDKKFVMPFSQIPATSPMIRLRIGDLIKSNYSRFNLARIFGIGHGDVADGAFHIAGDDKTADAEAQAEVAVSLSDYRKKIRTPPETHEDTTNGYQDGVLAQVNAGMYKVAEPDEGQPNRIILSKTTTVEVIKKEYPGAMIIPIIAPPPGWTPCYRVKLAKEADKTNAGDLGAKEFWVLHQKMYESLEQIMKDVPDIVALPETADFTTDVPKWFDPSTNAIVRSFESTAGRGLAGFITSLSFNHDDATWETRKLGSRAPMWMTVDINFEPIHDLPPGLDEEGFNRAPIYNVGDIMNGLIGPDIHGTQPNITDDALTTKFDEERSGLVMSEPKDPETPGSA